jgi:hypothetical protein
LTYGSCCSVVMYDWHDTAQITPHRCKGDG